jgi:hypothetical protein
MSQCSMADVLKTTMSYAMDIKRLLVKALGAASPVGWQAKTQ